VKENVVSLRACVPDTAVEAEHSAADQTRDYILDMMQQLSKLARDRGEVLLGIMLDEVLLRYDPPIRREPTLKSS
jgi:hypothetical protein